MNTSRVVARQPSSSLGASPTPGRGRSSRDLSLGVLSAMLVSLLVCVSALPRFAELAALGNVVLTGAAVLVAVGALLCCRRRLRAGGLGVILGAVLGLLVEWSALVFYVGLFQR